METGIGGNSRMVRGKDMEYWRVLGEIYTWGKSYRVTDTGMEYTNIQMEMYTMDSGNKINIMVMDIRGGLMEMNIMDSSRMISGTERQSNKRKDNYTQSNTKKISLSAKVKYQMLLDYNLAL